jgi:glycerophosphoryl diester phosphodiesterase
MTLQGQSTMHSIPATLAIAGLLVLSTAKAALAFDLQGHRGTRGLMPENTLPAFARALEIGVTTLETDLAVTKDGVLVLSHDPVLNPDLARGPDGQWLAAPGPAIHSLTLAELMRYDVGRIKPDTKYAQQFTSQTPVDGTRIPRLAELFELAAKSGKVPRFNLEIKVSPETPGDTPDPEGFVRIVVDALRASGMADRVTIQSFDWRALLAMKRDAPAIETACLTYPRTLRDVTDDTGGRKPSPWLAGLDPAAFGGSVPRLAVAAGCRVWSPLFRDLAQATVDEAHALGLKVLPWTVNVRDDMARLIDMKVDGLITDYPDRAREVMRSKGLPLP